MTRWISAGALALALFGCKEQANPADTAKSNPQLGTPSAGGPTDDLGGHSDAGPLDGGMDAGK